MIDKDSNLLKLAARITKLRKERKLSIHALANAADIEYSLLQRVEKGKVNIQFTTLMAICMGLDIQLEELAKGTGFPY